MKIAVDAMGGDFAPEAPIEGALLAQPQCAADLVLFGNEEKIREALVRFNGKHSRDARSIEIVHAPQVIGMGDAGPVAIRRKREASLSVAMRFLGEEKVDAVVSAGNSAAVVSTARHFVGLTEGLRRPAFAAPLPIPGGTVLLVDAGAQAAAEAVNLAQSGALADAYLKVTEGVQSPRTGLLNIGQEPIKGTRTVQRAFELLARSRLNFIGNIEPRDIFSNRADVAVCDGFVGNLLLKIYESLSESFLHLLESQVEECDDLTLAALRKACERIRKVFHYENVGGAPLLGVRKTVIVAHGRSGGQAVANAIQMALRMAGDRVCDRMREELESDSILAELKHRNAVLMLESIKTRWGFGESANH